MKMNRTAMTACVLAGLFAAPSAGIAAEEAAKEEDWRQAFEAHKLETQAALDEARANLDQAAKQLAEVYKKTHKEGSRHHRFPFATFGQRSVLGVLLGRADDTGVLVSGVTPGSGAGEAGIESGDKLVKIGDVALDGDNGRAALLRFMASVEPGDAVAVRFLRDGESHDTVVNTQAAPDHGGAMARIMPSDSLQLHIPHLGRRFNCGPKHARPGPRLIDMDAALSDYFGVDAGVLVVEAPESGELESGDVLLQLDGNAVTSARDARRTIKRADGEIAAKVRRKNRRQSVQIDPAHFSPAIAKRIKIEIEE